MTDLTDIKQARQQKEQGFAVDNQPVRATLVAIEGSTKVPDQVGWVWAKDQNGGLVKAFNNKVADRPGLAVLIKTKAVEKHGAGHAGMPEVIDIDWESLSTNSAYQNQSYIKEHASTHEWRGGFPGRRIS